MTTLIEPYDEKHEDRPNAHIASPMRDILNAFFLVSIERPATDAGNERREKIG